MGFLLAVNDLQIILARVGALRAEELEIVGKHPLAVAVLRGVEQLQFRGGDGDGVVAGVADREGEGREGAVAVDVVPILSAQRQRLGGYADDCLPTRYP